jgi:type IV secretory pathway VirB4 component
MDNLTKTYIRNLESDIRTNRAWINKLHRANLKIRRKSLDDAELKTNLEQITKLFDENRDIERRIKKLQTGETGIVIKGLKM